MESVVFDGKEFIKASVLAEKFRYTQDYLGQLCRGKKVDARLVGRAWYINLDSLNSHRTARYKATVKPEEKEVTETRKTSNHYLSRIDVEPVLKQKTVKIMKGESGKLTEFSMKYEGDDYSLIPRVNKSAISSSLHITPAEAEKIKVHKDKEVKNITNFKAEPLPEVFLSGSIKIEGIDEATEETPSTVEETTVSPIETAPEPPKTPINKVKIRTLSRPVAKTIAPTSQAAVSPVAKPLVKQNLPLQRPVRLTTEANKVKHPPHTFTPVTLMATKTTEVEVKNSIAAPVTAVLIGLIAGFFILTTEILIETTGDSRTDNFVINASNVSQAARVIFSKF